MFGDYVFEKASAQYTDKILLLDDENLNSQTNYISTFSAHGFEIVRYTDDLTFRLGYDEKLKVPGGKLAVIAHSNQYIPFDVRRRLSTYIVSLENLFPKLHTATLQDIDKAGLDLLCAAYPMNFDDLRQKRDTEMYLRLNVYASVNVKAYLKKTASDLIEKARSASRYWEWFMIAEEKSQMDVMAVQNNVDINTQEINRLFQQYALECFGKLSQVLDKSSPVLISKAMEYMFGHSEKFIVVVMDGMSEFDWKILSCSFTDIQYEKTSMFAMIPSTTSISRQCLLSGKYPSQLLEPWKQSKEKTEFVNCAKELGYSDILFLWICASSLAKCRSFRRKSLWPS